MLRMRFKIPGERGGCNWMELQETVNLSFVKISFPSGIPSGAMAKIIFVFIRFVYVI